MRRITFGVANSLDNFIARTDGAVDWLYWSDDVSAIMTDFWKMIDTVIIGRKSFEAALKMGGGGSYPGVKTYVFSRTLKKDALQDVEVVLEDAVGFVRKLKGQQGKDICCMGGGAFANSLFEADLIDEIGFNIHPVLLGSGIPLYLEMKRQINLELLECRSLKGGCVLVRYRVKR
jgi:dihydrofolate reductase